MRVYILSFLLSALFIVSECLFFGIPKSTCSYDNQCLKTRRCIERSNPFCQKSSKSNNFKKSMIFQQFLLIISCYLVLANNQTQITMLIAFWYVYKLRGQNLGHLWPPLLLLKSIFLNPEMKKLTFKFEFFSFKYKSCASSKIFLQL